jgi:hypothetical protein
MFLFLNEGDMRIRVMHLSEVRNWEVDALSRTEGFAEAVKIFCYKITQRTTREATEFFLLCVTLCLLCVTL